MLSYNVLNSWVEKLMKKDLPVKIKTSNITTLSTKDINKLKAGDIVLKKTGNQKHAYIVSYKEDNQGICLTYVDASCAETVSYDYIEGAWVYNSTDVTTFGSTDRKYLHYINICYDPRATAELAPSAYIMFTVIIKNNSSTPFTVEQALSHIFNNQIYVVAHGFKWYNGEFEHISQMPTLLTYDETNKYQLYCQYKKSDGSNDALSIRFLIDEFSTVISDEIIEL